MTTPTRWFGAGLCALLIMAVPAIAVADVGRLFFTPSERTAVEEARRVEEAGPVHEFAEPEPEITLELFEVAAQELKPTITIDGYVRRSNGRATLWVNGENSYDGDLSASRIDPRTASVIGAEIRLTPIDEDTPIRLKPGQSYDPNSMTTTDAYETRVLADEFVAD